MEGHPAARGAGAEEAVTGRGACEKISERFSRSIALSPA